ncbi:hypothetical protein CR513_23586, partial [Mucuna pruriens]
MDIESNEEMKGTLPIKPTVVVSLSLKGSLRKSFEGKYGKILRFMEVEVQLLAFSALMLHLLGLLTRSHLGRIRTHLGVASISILELSAKKRLNRSNVDGLPQSYLKERMEGLFREEDWSVFMDVLTLTIYRTILSPVWTIMLTLLSLMFSLHAETKEKNLIIVIFVDTYYTFNYCYERKGRKPLCFLPMLYLWLVTHLFSNKCKMTCLMEDAKWCCVKTMISKE